MLGVLGLLEMRGYIVVEREHPRATRADQEAKPWSRAVRTAPPGAVNCSIRFMVGFFMLPSSKLKPSQLSSLVFLPADRCARRFTALNVPLDRHNIIMLSYC